tara:strand:- start:336 stop:536 length:201 start_codon:yes stop_codon:yes gene_type:complete
MAVEADIVHDSFTIVVVESREVGTEVAGREVGPVELAGTDVDDGTDVVVDVVDAGGRALTPTSNWE